MSVSFQESQFKDKTIVISYKHLEHQEPDAYNYLKLFENSTIISPYPLELVAQVCDLTIFNTMENKHINFHFKLLHILHWLHFRNALKQQITSVVKTLSISDNIHDCLQQHDLNDLQILFS